MPRQVSEGIGIKMKIIYCSSCDNETDYLLRDAEIGTPSSMEEFSGSVITQIIMETWACQECGDSVRRRNNFNSYADGAKTWSAYNIGGAGGGNSSKGTWSGDWENKELSES